MGVDSTGRGRRQIADRRQRGCPPHRDVTAHVSERGMPTRTCGTDAVGLDVAAVWP